MDFYMNPRCRGSSIDSSARLLLQTLDLDVALYLHTESDDSLVFDGNSEHAYSNVRALKEIDAVMETVQALGATTLEGMDTNEWTLKTVRGRGVISLYVFMCHDRCQSISR